MSEGVFVVAEHLQDQLDEITFELLGKGRELADNMSCPLTAVLLGHGAKELGNQLGAADKVIYVDHEQLANFNPESYSKVLAEVVQTHQPKLTLLPNTSVGMDLAAAISVDLDIPLVAYAVDLNVQNGSVQVSSQLYGGKIIVTSSCEGDQAFVSVIAGSFSPEKGRSENQPVIEEVSPSVDLSGLKIQFKQLIQPEAGDVDITQHDILVSIGRGIQSEDNIPVVQELADALDGALSASRPIVDNKWLPKTRQVGKSGLKVKPKCYLALGISGAPEHIEGMKDAELIIAINSDPEAPIFDYAHYGVAGDLFDIVSELTQKVKE